MDVTSGITGRQAVLHRGLVFGASLVTTAIVVLRMAALLSGDGWGATDIVVLALFGPSFAWVSLSFWAAVAGFAWLLLGRRSPGLVWPAEDGAAPAGRTAIVMPVYNEDVVGVFARLQAIYESVAATGHLDAFEFYVLSDSTDPDSWIAEEAAWSALCRRVDGSGRIFYRRRRENTGRKAGNIADFCRRWGRRTDYMVILDADSLMDGHTLVRMARLMDLNPRAGLIQAPPVVVNRNSLFARLVQFAGRVYGPVFSSGLAFWQLGDGNYWGHNAILRTAAFTAHCGLPRLPGKAPLGGEILSHDFVEAALLRRGGWQVFLAPELGGSYEESPPTLLDFVKRDRRWCQGNLQHARILTARGLHPMSRLHLLTGVMSYLSSPLWLAFLAAGFLQVAESAVIGPDYFGDTLTLFPRWPIFDTGLAVSLFAVTLGMLLLPRLLGVALTLREPWTAGRRLRLVASVVLELLLSTLLAPVIMLFHTGFVLQILFGLGVDWTRQRRDEGGTSWREAVDRHAFHTAFGAGLALLVWWLSPMLLWWLLPLVAGLVLSIPLSHWTARTDLGLGARRLGLFLTVDEVAPPPVLRRANALAAELEGTRAAEADGLRRVLADPALRALHVLLLAATPDAGPADRVLAAEARRKLEDGAAPGARPGAVLTAREKTALLYDAEALESLAGESLAGRDGPGTWTGAAA